MSDYDYYYISKETLIKFLKDHLIVSGLRQIASSQDLDHFDSLAIEALLNSFIGVEED